MTCHMTNHRASHMTISKMASSNSSHEWTKTEIDDVVTYYREEDILWNLSSKDYHNKDKRRVAFQRISEKMGISGKLKILFIHSFYSFIITYPRFI